MLLSICIVTVALAALASRMLAAAPGAAPGAGHPRARIGDLAWIAGTWRGGAGTTVDEETWSDGLGGAMLGMFRQVKTGSPVFYEVLLLEEDEQGVVLRMRHFHPGLTAWESERDGPQTLRLAEVNGTTARFEDVRPGVEVRLVYAREGSALTVTLEGLRKDRSPFATQFRFGRV